MAPPNSGPFPRLHKPNPDYDSKILIVAPPNSGPFLRHRKSVPDNDSKILIVAHAEHKLETIVKLKETQGKYPNSVPP